MKIIIAGRAGSGKSKLAQYLANQLGLTVLKTCTNRPKRFENEDIYHFYTAEQAAAVPQYKKLYLTNALDGYERWTNEHDLLAADICVLDGMGFGPATRLFQTAGHRVVLIYADVPEGRRRMAYVSSRVSHGKTKDEAIAEFEYRNKTENDMFGAIELNITKAQNAARHVGELASQPSIYHGYCVPEELAPGGRIGDLSEPLRVFHEDLFVHWYNDFNENSMAGIAGFLMRGKADASGLWAMGGYAKFCDPEPLILEPEDWKMAEWLVLCKLCGLKPDVTKRIVMHVPEIEAYIQMDGDKNEYAESEDADEKTGSAAG